MNHSAGNQPMREENVRALVRFFKRGIKAAGEPSCLGTELEHIVTTTEGAPVSYSDDKGVEWILKQLTGTFPDITETPAGDVLGASKPCAVVSLEPAAQLELSSGPFAHLDELFATFSHFEELIASILEPENMVAQTLGYHPTAHAGDLELIPKKRYQFMNAHFEKIGPWGKCMMRGSASTQISIDYYSVEDCLRKMRLASALTPLFSLMTDNAPWFEGAPRPHHMMRTEIWRYCDPARCGIVPHLMDVDFTLEDYAAYVLDTPAILIPDGKDGWVATEKTFGEAYADRIMDETDIEHAVSMFFNDVRLKTYIEIRPADSLPIPYVASYAALIKGLFYDKRNLNELAESLSFVDEAAIDQAKTDLMAQGWKAPLYGRSAGEWGDDLVARASRGLASDERAYLDPLAKLVAARTTLAMMAERKQR